MKRDIDDFSYSDRVESNKKKFSIMSLSENGFKEYIDKDSYTHYYLYEKHLDRYNKEVDERLRIKRECKVRGVIVRGSNNNVNVNNTYELKEEISNEKGEVVTHATHATHDERNVK